MPRESALWKGDCPQSVIVGALLSSCRRQVALRLEQVGQAKQHSQTLGVLVQTPVANFRIAEVPLHIQERVFHLRPLTDAFLFSLNASMLSGSNPLRRLGLIATRHSILIPAFSARFSTP